MRTIVSIAAGNPTVETMTLPNFLVIGAAKAGTTSLHGYLSQHPQVYVSPVKETNFFAFEGHRVDYRGPGDAQNINRTSITAFDAYQQQFHTVRDQTAVGEVSPLYLYLEQAPARIYHYLPGVRLVVVLRNPIDRAYSSFLHLRRDRREPVAQFEQALDQEEARIRANWAPLWHYRAMGFYFAQLKRYYERFGRERIRIYLYEHFSQDPAALLIDLFEFLEIDSSCHLDLSLRRNVSGIPKYAWLHDLLKRPHAIRSMIKSWLPHGFQRQGTKLLSQVRNRNLVKPKLSPAVRTKLLQLYHEDILRTQDLIQCDLSHWIK
jgi:hypothetical protein